MTGRLIEQVMASYDERIRHAGLFCASPERCLDAAVSLDLLQFRVARALVAARSLPGGGPRLERLRIADLAAPPLGWLKLGERPGREIVLGQIARPWQPGAQRVFPRDEEEFRRFDRPGYAKIVLSVHAEPRGVETSRLVLETRVQITDPASRRRFRRYWRLVGTFSGLLRRLAMRWLAAELGQPVRHHIEGEIEIARPPEVVFDVVADERNEPRYNPRLGNVEKLTAGPVGLGTRFRVRTAGRRGGIGMIIEFTEFDRPDRLASRTRIGALDIFYALMFEAVPGGTRMRWAGDLRPGGPLALLRPVLILLGRRQERAIWISLKQYLESGAARSSAPAQGPLDSTRSHGPDRRQGRRRSASWQAGPQEVAPGVYRLETGHGLTESNVYFVRSGKSWVLVDAAWPGRGPAIQTAAEVLFGAGTRPAAFLLTHFHPDHSGSALELARRWHLPVHVHPDELPFAGGGYNPAYAHPLDRWVVAPLLRLVPRRRLLQQQARESLEGTAVAFDPAAPLPGLPEWECISTPGHTPGHAAFFRSSDGVLISGDAVMSVNVNSLTDLLRHRHGVFGPPWITTWNWPLAQQSIETLGRLHPRIVASGHGPPLTGEPHVKFPR